MLTLADHAHLPSKGGLGHMIYLRLSAAIQIMKIDFALNLVIWLVFQILLIVIGNRIAMEIITFIED